GRSTPRRFWRMRAGSPSRFERPWAASAGLLVGQNTNVREVAVSPGGIEPVSDNEAIVDREADVVDADRHLPPGRFAEKAGSAQHFRPASPENLLQIGEGLPGVDDVLDDEHALAVERSIEVLEQSHFSGARRALGVAGDGDEVEGDDAVEASHKIGEKDE